MLPGPRMLSTIIYVVVLFFVLYTWFSHIPISSTNLQPTKSLRSRSFQPSGPESSRSLDAISDAALWPTSPSSSEPNGTGNVTCANLNLSSSVYIKPLEMIMESQWVPRLQDILTKMEFQDTSNSQWHFVPRKQVTVVVSDVKYAPSLLNWLVAAQVKTSPPIENIIVISFDKTLQALMDKKEIRSVYVNPDTVTCGQVRRRTSRIWIARCVIFRLLNHWGYDVMVYDTDAIVLRNLQDILNAHAESDIVGSAGQYPFPLGAKWGQTLCMGTVLFRSTRKTGEGLTLLEICIHHVHGYQLLCLLTPNPPFTK